MRTIYILVILVLLALALPAAPAHAGGIVSVCDEAHLLAALVGGGTVTFACSGTITLSNTITITADTTMDGSGQDITISGNDAVRVFLVALSGITLNLEDLTVADGNASHGGGISNHGRVVVNNCLFSGNRAGRAAGIDNFNTLIVNNSTFSSNTAIRDGGGISNHGTLSVNRSTFSGNAAGTGGGIYTLSTLVIISNSTFATNTADDGGGIYNSDDFGATVAVSNSTFSNNSAGNGGGIYSGIGGSITLMNTIVANSPAGGNCSGTIADGGGNLSYPDTTCPGINADSLLGPLQDNGGPTWTMALGEGSAAIDAADDAICAAPPVNNLDQRGFPRPWGAHCDIGAVEQIQEPSAVSLSTISAESASGAISPIIVFGLLLVALASICFCQMKTGPFDDRK